MIKEKNLFNEDQETISFEKANSFIVMPALPDKLKALLDIVDNLWWCWNSDAIELFKISVSVK